MTSSVEVPVRKHELSAPGSPKLSVKRQDNSVKIPKKKNRKYKPNKNLDPTAPLGVLEFEIKELISRQADQDQTNYSNDVNSLLNNDLLLPVYHRVVENVEILTLTSNGDGLAIIDNPVDATRKQVVVVPFGHTGDLVTLRVFKTHPNYVESDLLTIEKSSTERDNSLINCKYFGACSGCQYQHLTYDKQLQLKQNVISNAYLFFAPLLTKQNRLPSISKTEPSPRQYQYRTKLTPHFDVPRKRPTDYKRPHLGFGSKGRPEWRENIPGQGQSIIDIEECVIGTPILNQGMQIERSTFEKNFELYKKGATILLREDSEKVSNLDVDPSEYMTESDGVVKRYVTKSRQIVKEIIGEYEFEFSAGEFFQNNNSILPLVIDYVSSNLSFTEKSDNYLIDAYCGSGLFSITSAHSVTRVVGVEISADSVKFATRNAQLNKITNCSFIVGKAEKIFADIDLPNDETSIILDPPRKGCDEVFLDQLSAFKPRKIVYISCNVHSQLRDVEYFLNKTLNGQGYVVDSIKGFDFFPQTHHVESIAVLSRQASLDH